MQEIRDDFRSRCKELGPYLRMLRFVEEVGAEIVSSNNSQRHSIDTSTRHVLKASVFLHLYNLIESTVAACLRRISEEIRDDAVPYDRLVDEWQRSWLRVLGKTNEPLNPEARLKVLLEICEHLTRGEPIDFQPRLAAGNLDDIEIEKITKRHGIRLVLPRRVREVIKRPVVNNDGTLKLIRKKRNDLAHGLDSFADCGRDVSVRELRTWTGAVIRYLGVVIKCFESYLSSRGFERRKPA